jgi:AraC-like DNA-binding protein
MNGLRILSPANENIILSDAIPVNLVHCKLAGSHSVSASGSFGNILFHHFKGEGFDLWYSNYFIKQSSKFRACMGSSIIQLHIPFVNYFEICWEGLKNNPLENKQFGINYVPRVQATATFKPGEYHNFDIHFTKELLHPYAACCSRLAAFLEKVEKGEPAGLLDKGQFLSLEMIGIINNIIEYRYMEELAGIYFRNLVNELLVLVVARVAALKDEPHFSATEQNQAMEVKKIILSDFEEYHTVEQLSRMVNTSESKLQMVFKHVFGTTVSRFSQQARLEHGYRLLNDTNYPLRVICTMAGYPDPANFSVAFRKQYGFWPGYIQKKIKK